MTNASKLTLTKLLHTAIWAFFVAVIGYTLYCGIANDISRYAWIAIGPVILEGLVLLVFGGRCPLTLIARNYSDSEGHNFDIFMPNWLARYNKPIFTSLYVAGLLLVCFRLLQRRIIMGANSSISTGFPKLNYAQYEVSPWLFVSICKRSPAWAKNWPM